MTRINPATAVLLLGVFTIFAVILGSCHSGSDRPDVSTAATVLRGDLDGDGLPSVADAIGILRIVVGLDAQNPIADADADGSTTVNDAIAVLRCVVGLDDWPLGEMEAPPTRTIGPGTVTEGDFTIGAGERVECLGDTIVECTTATIAGELYSSSPTAAGTNAGSITIQAQGDVLLTGAMRAGNGSDGDLSANSGQGGNGGSVTINSANGDITIGVEAQTSADAPDPYLGAGDAGVGADDLLTAVPGAGGQGGSVSLSCPNGLLTLYPRAGLIHIGNGGDGGTGHIPADSAAEPSEPTDSTPDGGSSGTFAMHSEDFAGLEEQDGAIVIDPPEMLTGGNGGDGGGIWIGVEVGTPIPDEGSTSVRALHAAGVRTSVRTSDGEEDLVWLKGGQGGDSNSAGDPGDGAVGWTDRFIHASGMWGGDGGNCRFSFYTNASGERLPVVIPRPVYRGGNGGHGEMRIEKPDSDADNCHDGSSGSYARARGGNGGRVVEDELPAFWLANMSIVGGNGGDARADAQPGQDGGECCGDTPGQGGCGGDAGRVAAAIGGDGGDQVAGKGGDAGSAEANGADGGDGGNGLPPGAGGAPTLTVTATAGQPGEGSPAGTEGETSTQAGEAGSPGRTCPTTATHGVVTSDSPQRTICGYRGFYTTETYTDQVQPSFSLGGTNFPVLAWQGQSMIFSPDNSRLWVGNELGGICLYRNPLTTNGDRAPDLRLHIAGTQWFSIWYEAQADILYATTMDTQFIHAWDNASVGTANRAPDRSIEVPGYHGQGYLTGAAGSSVLFMATHLYTYERMLVFQNAAQLDGLHAADNYWVPQDFTAVNAHALSWDQGLDLLYIGVPNLNQVHVYAEASTIDGVQAAAVPDRIITIDYPGMAVGDWISGVVVLPDQDILVVSMFQGQTMVFTGASALQGTPEPAKREQLGTMALGLGVFRQ